MFLSVLMQYRVTMVLVPILRSETVKQLFSSDYGNITIIASVSLTRRQRCTVRGVDNNVVGAQWGSVVDRSH